MSTAFTTQTLGRTEKALNAILYRELAGTGLTEPDWVTLVLASIDDGGPRSALVARLAGAFKTAPADAEAQVGAVVARGLIAGDREIALTDEGRALYRRLSGRVAEITAQLWGDLPTADLETAARVLETILVRADAELAAA